MVRRPVRSAEWNRELGLTVLALDNTTVDAFIDEAPALAGPLSPRAE